MTRRYNSNWSRKVRFGGSLLVLCLVLDPKLLVLVVVGGAGNYPIFDPSVAHASSDAD